MSDEETEIIEMSLQYQHHKRYVYGDMPVNTLKNYKITIQVGTSTDNSTSINKKYEFVCKNRFVAWC